MPDPIRLVRMVSGIGQLERAPPVPDTIRLARMVRVIFPATVEGRTHGSCSISLTIRTRRMESAPAPLRIIINQRFPGPDYFSEVVGRA